MQPQKNSGRRNTLKLDVAMKEALSVRNHKVYTFRMVRIRMKKSLRMKKAKFSKINTSEKYFSTVWLFLKSLLKVSQSASATLCNKMSGLRETEGMIKRYFDEK